LHYTNCLITKIFLESNIYLLTSTQRALRARHPLLDDHNVIKKKLLKEKLK